MNGEYLRGEVYWVSSGDSLGSELQSGRPAVIISNDFANREQETVVVAFITQSERPRGVQQYHVKVKVLDEERRVICQQVRTVDKSRLLRFIARISNEDMKRVSGALATSLSLTPPAVLEAQAAKKEGNPTEEFEKLKLELEIAKRMYERVLNQLVEMRVAADIARYEYDDEAEAEEEEYEEYEEEDIEEDVEEPETEDVEEEDIEPEVKKNSKVNVNTATWQEIVETGIGEKTARDIVAYRKKNGLFKVKRDLLNVKRFGTICLKKYGSKLTLGEATNDNPVTGKININTASKQEIMDATGCPHQYAGYIVTYRTKNGHFVSLEELYDVPYLSKRFIENNMERLTIGEELPEVEEKKQTKKLNINTASSWDFMAVGFGKDVAARIVSYRKSHKKFDSIKDLWLVDGVDGKILRDLSEVLYVEEVD